MTSFSTRHQVVEDREQQEVNEDLLMAINQLAQLFSWGTGVPTHAPAGREIYLRRDGAGGSTLYVYEGVGWVAK